MFKHIKLKILSLVGKGWICKNQAGRRNLTPEELMYLIGKRYEAEKKAWGASDGFRGNGREDDGDLVRGKFFPLLNSHAIAEKIASGNGINERTVRMATKYAQGVDAAEEACPGVKQDLLFTQLKTGLS